jgi:hypothetical protein
MDIGEEYSLHDVDIELFASKDPEVANAFKSQLKYSVSSRGSSFTIALSHLKRQIV